MGVLDKQMTNGKSMRMGSKVLIVEARLLEEIQRGSFEDMLSNLDQVVSENQNRFGGESVLFASFPGHIVVLNEHGEFMSVAYTMKDGVVALSEDVARLDVPVINEDDLAGRGVDKFFNGGSLSESLRSLVSSPITKAIPLDEAKAALARLFEGGRVWRSYMETCANAISPYAWDAKYGSLKIEVHPVFGDVYAEDASEQDAEAQRETVNSMLFGLESRLRDIIDDVTESFTAYAARRSELPEDMGEKLERFDAFAKDYLNHVIAVARMLSETIHKGQDGCAMCSALVHDEVARRFKTYELGGRFVRKVASELA